ncbi:MAG: hypothetical protein US68_C0017G0007 [Candidatus Shapirobacteria bacterium GW2011_GWE1_38_10]|uniref:Uncharacterized protein n=1 Tax=Candidatus Shapirobacteria bacterium GW2011_GWE1_38_10 TaxID=1618488 RepID=A0A0G0L9A6_9BACT|nr:MAG: hypothetical protein US46_C0004G0094 [Candidatus Shapirobacteria bacterium GW2011_GWF2_37_20]KKQ49226.1 MAG: hypothetical protein US68_C0017G0007 [Candidatus Shapirobacteria bacterium GW2011_GWE1_38_10]HBP50791.1 hypothetical protein [Candidatus Shapirobacteria bacterium]
MTHESIRALHPEQKRETPCEREIRLQRDLSKLPTFISPDTPPKPIFPIKISPGLKTGTRKLTRP